jgi:hypothetical protein
MPKGSKLHIDITKYVYFCGTKKTERVFETETEYKTYLKRHAKMCSCKGIVESEIATYFVDGKEYINDLSI